MTYNTKTFYKFMINRYIEEGYLYSGSVIPNEKQELNAINELIKLNLIEKNKSNVNSYRLVEEIRKDLAIKHNLLFAWGEKSKIHHVYTNNKGELYFLEIP